MTRPLQSVYWMGPWNMYRDEGLLLSYDVTLGQGLFPSVDAVGIANDDMSSLSIEGEFWTLTATATILIASGSNPGPFTQDVTMTFLVPSGTTQLLVAEQFDHIDTGLGTITYVSAIGGTFTPDGQIIIPEFSIQASKDGFTLGDTFALSTGFTMSPQGHFSQTGSPVDSAGNVTLVGSGHLSGADGQVDDDFLVVLSGTLVPQS